jgi:hypothetical protein
MAYLQTTAQYLPGKIKENHENVSQKSQNFGSPCYLNTVTFSFL